MSNATHKPVMTVGNMARMAMLTAAACLLDLIPGIPLFGNIYKLDFSMLPVLDPGAEMPDRVGTFHDDGNRETGGVPDGTDADRSRRADLQAE